MPARALLIEIRFVDGRYHGRDDWPPSPFRLFQALVAGAYGGRWAAETGSEKDAAFGWLERLDPPHIAYPPPRVGASATHYVPNNDLDAVGGDPRRIDKIRVAKRVAPLMFDCEAPILFAWPFDAGEPHAAKIACLSDRLHTLGLGFDAAFARSETTSWDEAEARLAVQGWRIARPTGGSDLGPTCPTTGSLHSLKQRHRESGERFRKDRKEMLFANATKPLFRQVAYASPPTRALFDLVDSEGKPRPWPFDRIVELTERLRDGATTRLSAALKKQAGIVSAVLVGRRDAVDADKAARVRIVPLPSIGHRHVDRAIRRVLVEIPANCPLRTDDLQWAFSGLAIISDDGEILCELAAGANRGMLAHYCVEGARPARRWRTTTPMALPPSAARRRLEPSRLNDPKEQKGGAERANEEARATNAVRQALRHAEVGENVLSIRVQREPFEAKGARAEAFAAPPRFVKERLWHVDITFAQAIPGPLVLGDGRFLGLGLMAPVVEVQRDVMTFALAGDSRVANADRVDLLRAVRRALMALARETLGGVPVLFSGHEADGRKASSGRHRHVFFGAGDFDADGFVDEIIVAAPGACDRSSATPWRELTEFEQVCASLETVRAGRLGVITLEQKAASTPSEAWIGPSRSWESATAYRPTRHAKRDVDMTAAIRFDVLAECMRRGLPEPEVQVLEYSAGPNGGGIAVHLRLNFTVAVRGPILIGRDSHAGGGLFVPASR